MVVAAAMAILWRGGGCRSGRGEGAGKSQVLLMVRDGSLLLRQLEEWYKCNAGRKNTDPCCSVHSLVGW
jgi:hypothetical protein